MQGGTLVISRAVKLFPHIKERLEELGFMNVEVTGEERDSLHFVINEKRPRLVLIESFFYQAATPFMMGELLKRFPNLSIAAVSVYEYPDSLAAWFIFYGVRSYINLWEGFEEFQKGLQVVRRGENYISPKVKGIIETYPEWPNTKQEKTKRLMEILVLLCNGFNAESIGKELHLTRKTVYNHLERLYDAFNVKNRDEMVAKAWELRLVTQNDMRFLDRRKEPVDLPEWAAAKQAIEGNRERETGNVIKRGDNRWV